MRLPADLLEWLEQHDLEPTSSTPCHGGCINQVSRLDCSNGQSLLLKQHPRGAALFNAEAAGLRTLAQCAYLRVPDIIAKGEQWLLLEWLEPGQQGNWEQFGQALAKLHSAPMTCFGFSEDTYCGAGLQPNQQQADGHRFYQEQRYGYQLELARNSGKLSAADCKRCEQLLQRLPEIIPTMQPALLHGDLWGGNTHICADGSVAMIDPACYWGWPEADLAMTQLFGGFPQTFYDSYVDSSSHLATDWQQRVDLHNLYHLLNHLNLFGGSYGSQAMSVVRQWT